MIVKIIATLLALGLSLAQASTNGFCNLVWSDEFSGPNVASHWQKDRACHGGGNNEMQCYTDRAKNIFIEDGKLVLKAFRETYTGSWSGCTNDYGCDWTKPYTSGRLNTRNSASWTYGRFETRAKLPSGYQLWPAIWMMPVDNRYGGWAASGEIDIMEARGNDPWHTSGTLHHGGAWPNNVWTTTGDHGVGVDLSKDFHVYTLEWTRDYMKWYIDNTLIQNYDMNRWWNSSARGVYSARGQPFDQRFHFILNLAVGGAFFGNQAPVTDAQSAQWAVPEMRVDYVRVYQQGGSCGGNPTSNQPSQAPDSGVRPTTQVVPTSNAGSDGRCNNQAYDQATYTCTLNESGRQVLCPRLHAACGQACYLPDIYCCNNGNLLAKAQCPVVNPTTRQTSATTSSRTSTTVTATSSPPESGVCNGQRYDVTNYSCTTNDQGSKVLCQKGMQSCGSACFNPNSYCCRNGGLLQASQC